MENAVRWILRASILYDLVALVLLLVMPQWLFDLFAHPRPADPFLFRLAALPLFMVPPLYWMASMRPLAEPRLVRASVILRVVGGIGIALVVLWHRPEGAMAYWTFALGDLAWAVAIGGVDSRARRGIPPAAGGR